MPTQGTSHVPTVADVLLSTTHQRLLGLLLGQPDRAFPITELIACTGSGSGGVQREVRGLVESGLVRKVPPVEAGRSPRYQANAESSVFGELRSFVEKTLGLPAQLRRLLAARRDVRLAILRSAPAPGELLVVSERLTGERLTRLVEPVAKRLGWTLVVGVRGPDGIDRETVEPLLREPHEILVGSLDEFPALRDPQLALFGVGGDWRPPHVPPLRDRHGQ